MRLHYKKISSLLPFFLVFILLFNPVFTSLASGLEAPADRYQSAYRFFQKAEIFFHRQNLEDSLEYYRRAGDLFAALREQDPAWNSEAIKHRLGKCREQIRRIEETLTERKSWEKPLKIHFLDVGQGDGALIQCPDGSNIVIDGGGISGYSFPVNYLRQAGIKKIDLMIATHPHSDHIGGLPKLLKSFPVDTVLDSGKEHTSELYHRYLETIKASPGTKFKLGRAGDRYRFGKVELLIFHPSSSLLKKINDCSIVVKLKFGKETFLFTGDAEKKAEREIMLRGFNLRSTVLKVGHHGSDTSTTPSFFSAVSPRTAVISVGKGNSFGHPRPEVLRRLQSRGVKIYRTDLQGTIVFISNGNKHRVEFPGKASYPDYDIPPQHEGKIIGNRESMIYHLPGGRYCRKILPEDREYFESEDDAQAAGYRKSWY